MLKRILQTKIEENLEHNPCVAILGPRQIGKTTLALEITKNRDSVYLDLELSKDLAKLQDPFTYLSKNQEKLIVLDEIQRMPGLFQTLRGLVDKRRQQGKGNGQFLILGSASIDLLKQASESLAGRINYLELQGFSVFETAKHEKTSFDRLWLRGGFPPSYLASSDDLSAEWREDFICTYLERDIPQLGPRVPATTLRRLWTMLAHLHGGMVNVSKLSTGLDVSNVTVNRYIDLLCDLLLIRKIEPWHKNTKKRLVKSPRIYVRDSGILHRLLNITSYDGLLSYPLVGQSWEGFVIENILSVIPKTVKCSFYRTLAGAEIDLVLEFPNQETWAIEVKRTSSPKVEKGFYNSCEDLQPTKAFIVYNGAETFTLPNGVIAIGLLDIIREIVNH